MDDFGVLVECEIKVTYIQWWDKKSSSHNCSMMTAWNIAFKNSPQNIYRQNKYEFFFYKCIHRCTNVWAPLALGRRWPSWPKKINAIPECVKVELGPKHTQIAGKTKMLTIDTSNKSANNAIIPNSDNQSSHTRNLLKEKVLKK